MTDQHPLTDRICFNILSNKYDVSGSDWHKYQNTVDLMRAAADWQLAEVIKWLRGHLQDHEYLQIYLIESLAQAMRPNTTHRGQQ
ncbi:MAG: hypothetical protein EBV86_17920 [Marivivens sp.]|nr:hypothetical protein [Marivivens sp.]